LGRYEELENTVNMGLQSESIENGNFSMVNYQYMCRKCGEVTESRFPMGEYPQVICCSYEPCDGMCDKIISTPGIFIPKPTHEARIGRGRG
jgi:predicted nucleic acid-binding Zn ribbon protein